MQGQEVKFERPKPETDRLFMNVGGADMIEVRCLGSFHRNG